MEQLVWAIIIIIFIIFTVLKNRARYGPDTGTDRNDNTEYKTRKERDKISRYMEELLGIEIPETKPRRRIDKEKPESLEKTVKPKIEEKIGQFESPLVKKYEQKTKPSFPEKKNVYGAKFPWGTLSKKDLPRAIVLSEIIGPPISKRKGHRLF
ncbi:MAG: hypothetical protein ACYSWS_03170 [Planctomycetota bacterium]|jgi:hypothetical protein